jgi:fermentation-respiration switch protein FrsA (DUF1100 family)
MKYFIRQIAVCCYLMGLMQAQDLPPELKSMLDVLKNDHDGQMSRMAEMMLGKNGGNQLFYFPLKEAPDTPKTFGLSFEECRIPTSDGETLHGWFLPVKKGQSVKGTVVFSHGNAGALGHHLGLAKWWPEQGYQVLMYDYRGFGQSTGAPSREGLIRDVEAAFRFAQGRPDVAKTKIFSYAHSLGGAKSIVALSRTKVPGLRGVITDGTFASYVGMADFMAGNFGKKLVTDELAPKDSVGKLSVPLLIVHGSDDEIVPISQGEQLFAAAGKQKTFFRVAGGRHSDALARRNGEYRRKVLDWMAQYGE